MKPFIQRLLPDNPVLTRELRSRMRGTRAHWILFGYIGFLSAVLMFRYGQWWQEVGVYGGSSRSPQLGGEFFALIRGTQIFLALCITPALTSGSLTLEREQRTMDMLAVTPLPRRAVISGKLLAAVAFTGLLIISSLPLISICFMLGSIDAAQVLSAYLELLGGSFLAAALGVLWSSLSRTTTQAVMFTYMTLCLIVIAGLAAQSAAANRSGWRQEWVNSMIAFLFGDKVFGVRTIEGIGFTVFCLLCGIGIATAARVRLEKMSSR